MAYQYRVTFSKLAPASLGGLMIGRAVLESRQQQLEANETGVNTGSMPGKIDFKTGLE
jgi:hypothetical protein